MFKRMTLTGAAALALTGGSVQAGPLIHPVVMSGDEVPGSKGTEEFVAFGSVQMGIQDRLLISALVDGEEVAFDSDSGLYMVDPKGIIELAREGDFAINEKTKVFFGDLMFLSGSMNSIGQVCFTASMTGDVTDENNQGIWFGDAAELNIAARKGDAPADGGDGGSYGGLGRPVLSDTGLFAYRAQLTGTIEPGVDSGIWAGDINNIEQVALELGPAPTTGGETFSSFGQPSINANGDVAFTANLSGAPEANSALYLSLAAGDLTLLAREGEPLGGVIDENYGPFNTIGFGSAPALNAAGLAAVRNVLTGRGITEDDDEVLLRLGGPQPVFMAREGQPAPGTGANFAEAGAFASTAFLAPLLNHNDATAFTAGISAVTAPGRTGLWRTSALGGLALVAREGGPAPGVSRETFGEFSVFNFTRVINNVGQVAFRALLSDGTAGIWATNAQGELRLMVRAGEEFDFGKGDVRVISDVILTGSGSGANGVSTPLSADGRLAFVAMFEDGSRGVFVADTDGIDINPADFNGDGVVDGVDLGILLAQFGRDGSADLNNDGVVDGLDIGILLANWTLG